jgi:phosphoadenosine phosphosulfate reductase
MEETDALSFEVDIQQLRRAYSGLDTEAMLFQARSDFGSRLAASSSFQTQSAPLLHMISRVIPDTTVLFLDTGYHFPETLEYRDRLVRDWGLNVRILHPANTPDVGASPEPYRVDPDLCCYWNKVEPLRRALADYDALLSGIRRDQTRARATARVAEQADGHVRIHPLLSWDERKIWEYIDRHDLPTHPLFQQGYVSIGCAPCTRPVHIGEGQRDGRWAGTGKTECGLHLPSFDDAGDEPRRSTG